MDLNNLILFFVLIGFSLFFYKYFLFFSKKSDLKLNITAKFRLLVMITLLITLVIFNKYYIFLLTR